MQKVLWIVLWVITVVVYGAALIINYFVGTGRDIFGKWFIIFGRNNLFNLITHH